MPGPQSSGQQGESEYHDQQENEPDEARRRDGRRCSSRVDDLVSGFGRGSEAHRSSAAPAPIRPDFFFTFLTSLRALATIASNDRDTAEQIYADLLPHRDGPPAGAESVSLALHPVAHTLGQLAVFLGRHDEAVAHFTRAAAIADRWHAPHWSADARAHAAHVLGNHVPNPRQR